MKALFFSIFMFIASGLVAQNNEIQLLVRADDIGSFHAANVACIESYQNGIARSVELMPPCPWFFEAVEMLNANSGYDVGIHLTLTSEWEGVKWRPLTNCPSITDEMGNFFPMVWKNDDFPNGSSIQEADWDLAEVEQELRAQIEMSLKHVPHISHLSTHMGFTGFDPGLKELVEQLAEEYDLTVDGSAVKYFEGWGRGLPYEKWEDKFCENLLKLKPGKYLFIEHPAKNTPEMEKVGHVGNYDVAVSRDWVTRVFTSEKVKQTIQQKGIKLISYRDLKVK